MCVNCARLCIIRLMKTILTLCVLFIFSGCQLFEDSPELKKQKQELALKKLQTQQEKELAALEMQKTLATIEKEKALELQRLKNELKSKELNVNSEAELELIKQKVTLQESNNALDYEKYLLMFLALLLIVIAGFIFYYFKKKREDELRAYEDNLKKYFYHKENEARLKIADKILDTLKEGNLSQENEQKLINAFAKDQHDYDNDAEIVEVITEETSAEQTAIASFEHKENNDV